MDMLEKQSREIVAFVLDKAGRQKDAESVRSGGWPSQDVAIAVGATGMGLMDALDGYALVPKCAPFPLWIVGRSVGSTWEFQAVFMSKPEAVAACEDGAWFVAPAVVGVKVPTETQDWPGCYYPLARKEG